MWQSTKAAEYWRERKLIKARYRLALQTDMIAEVALRFPGAALSLIVRLFRLCIAVDPVAAFRNPVHGFMKKIQNKCFARKAEDA